MANTVVNFAMCWNSAAGAEAANSLISDESIHYLLAKTWCLNGYAQACHNVPQEPGHLEDC